MSSASAASTIVYSIQPVLPYPSEDIPNDFGNEDWGKYFNFDDATSESVQPPPQPRTLYECASANLSSQPPMDAQPSRVTEAEGATFLEDQIELGVSSHEETVEVAEELSLGKASSPTCPEESTSFIQSIDSNLPVSVAKSALQDQPYMPGVCVPRGLQTPVSSRYPSGGLSGQALPPFAQSAVMPEPRMCRPLPARALGGTMTHGAGIPSPVAPNMHQILSTIRSVFPAGQHNVSRESSSSLDVWPSVYPSRPQQPAVNDGRSSGSHVVRPDVPLGGGAKSKPPSSYEADRLKALRNLTFEDVIPGLAEKWELYQVPNNRKRQRSNEGEGSLTFVHSVNSSSTASGSSSSSQHSDERPAKSRKLNRGSRRRQ